MWILIAVVLYAPTPAPQALARPLGYYATARECLATKKDLEKARSTRVTLTCVLVR